MDDLSKNQIFAVHGIAGAGSVALATGFTYPLDTIKVLTQVLPFRTPFLFNEYKNDVQTSLFSYFAFFKQRLVPVPVKN